MRNYINDIKDKFSEIHTFRISINEKNIDRVKIALREIFNICGIEFSLNGICPCMYEEEYTEDTREFFENDYIQDIFSIYRNIRILFFKEDKTLTVSFNPESNEIGFFGKNGTGIFRMLGQNLDFEISNVSYL